MKIKEFFIRRYGPLPNTGRISLHNFNLFFGKNEDGKTLTIDALVKLLLGRNIRDFEHIDRVDENPEGYVIIEDDKGKEIKLPEKGDLTKVVDLTPSECCNIFIVRNSNLSIARDIAQESEFYTNVTDRLTGLRTKYISEIKKKLQEMGKLTRAESSADLSDNDKFGKIKSKVKEAQELIGKIDELEKKILEEGFDKLEEHHVEIEEEIDNIKQGIKSLEDARKREKYEKGKEALDKLKDALERYKQLEIYNENDEQLWREREKDAKNYGEEEKKDLIELQKNEEEFKEISEKLSEAEKEFWIFDNRKKKLDDEVKPELKNYEMGIGKVKSEETKNRFYAVAAITSAVLLSISMLGVIMNPSPIFYGLLVSFLISTVIFAALRFSFTQKKAHFVAVFERIRLAISSFDLDAESPKEIFSNIQKFDEEYQKKYDELQKIKRRKENLEEKIRELQNRTIPTIEKKIKDAEEKIDEIKIKSREGSLEQYTEKLKLKQELERSIEEQKSILKSHFGEKSKKVEDNILQWEEEIGNLEAYKDKSRDKQYSEIAASELEEKKREFEEELEDINNRMESLQKEMDNVQQKANEILRLEGEYLYCKTSVDLKAIKEKLQESIDENETNKDNVLEVMKIFEEIEAEEKEKVSELFGKESPIPKYFNEITDGLYEEVTFNQGTGKIEVKRRDGKILEAEKLSGGAYDQLYFSIRLALGEKLLKGKKGFFVMDDPFVKADPDRLQRQIKMLKKISELGWQVIYFSAKGEIRDTLEEDIKKGAINHVEIQGIFS